MGVRILFRDSDGREGVFNLSPEIALYIGRALDCALRTDDASVSRKHSVIRMEQGSFYVEDLGSSNGTYVNNVRVTKHRLIHNDVVRCGSLFLRYLEGDLRPQSPGDFTVVPAGMVGGRPVFAGAHHEIAAPREIDAPADQDLQAGANEPSDVTHPAPPLCGGPPWLEERVPSAPRSDDVNDDDDAEDQVVEEVVEARRTIEALQRAYDSEVAAAKQLRAEISVQWDRNDELRCALADRYMDEERRVVRHPALEVTGDVKPTASIRVRIDLTREMTAATAGPPIPLTELETNWSELPVAVRVESSHLLFPDGNEGTVLVRRAQPSVGFTLRAEVAAELPPSGEIEIRAIFRHRNRFCGEARCLLRAGPRWIPPSPAPSTAVVVLRGAEGPDLTVNIYRERTMPHDYLFWTIDVDDRYRALIKTKSAGGVMLPASTNPGLFVQGLFKAAAGCPPGLHLARLKGIGELLWDMTPECFRKIYWTLRDAAGDDFSIQFVVDDPWIPWELMRPKRDGSGGLELLAETHPLARGFLEYPDQMRPILPVVGKLLTVAPDYKMRPQLVPLPSAREESEEIQRAFSAEPVGALAATLLAVLTDDANQAVSVLHFAGHGSFDPIQAQNSTLSLEDGDLTVHDVRRQEVSLGERYGTLVILNACELGATGDVLGTMGGWAEAFAYRRFGGVVAPLWAVDDGHAGNAIVTFLELVLKEKETVGRALLRVRREFGTFAPTYASYLYYGDVNARFE